METSLAELINGPATPATPTADKNANELGQESFMKLMLTQLEFQDPLKPVDNTEFIAQTAQFSSVAGINAMRDSLDKFVQDQGTMQTLYSANLLGKTAMVNTSEVTLSEDTPTEFEFDIPQQTNSATVLFTDQTGAVVQQLSLGGMSPGTHSLSWDGTGDDNSRLAPGDYSVRIEYQDITGEQTAASVSVASTIDSVSFGTSGNSALLTTSNGTDIKLADVTKIKNI